MAITISGSAKAWWKAAGTRAVKTFFQVLAAELTGFAVFSEVDWTHVLAAAAFAAVYSLVTSLAGLPELGADTEESEG